jgi:hypothetical protein
MIQAKIPGKCSRCHEAISVGENIKDDDSPGKWYHVDCVPAAEKWAITHPVNGCDHEHGFLSMTVRGTDWLVCPDCSAKFEGHGVPVQFRGQENDDPSKHYALYPPRDCVGCKKYRGKRVEELWAIHMKWIDTGVEDTFVEPEPVEPERIQSFTFTKDCEAPEGYDEWRVEARPVRPDSLAIDLDMREVGNLDWPEAFT